MAKIYRYKWDLILCNNPDECTLHYNFNKNLVINHRDPILRNNVELYEGGVILKKLRQRSIVNVYGNINFFSDNGYTLWIREGYLYIYAARRDDKWVKNGEEVDSISFVNKS